MVTTVSPGFAGVLEIQPNLAFERAAAELRAGRPIVIDAAEGLTIVAALGTVSPRAYRTFSEFVGVHLVMPTLTGGPAEFGAACPLADLGYQDALRMVIAGRLSVPATCSTTEDSAAVALDICRHALLLPAVLIAPIAQSATLSSGIYHATRDRLIRPATDCGYEFKIVSEAEVPLSGNIRTRFLILRGGPVPRDQVVLIVGDPDPSLDVPIHVHSGCLTGDLFGALDCGVGGRLQGAVADLNAAGGGVLVYLDLEGRGTSASTKLHSTLLPGIDFETAAYQALLARDDFERRRRCAASILTAIGFHRVFPLACGPVSAASLPHPGTEVVTQVGASHCVMSERVHRLCAKSSPRTGQVGLATR